MVDWSKVDKTDTCWNWTGAVNGSGYGPHRKAYQEQVHGPMHPKLYVLHRCDNPRCIRLEHLFQGTQSDNMMDCSAKGRLRPYRYPRGEAHPYFGKTTSDANKKAMSVRKRKPFRICGPDGLVIEGENLTQFCKTHGLNQGRAWQVINGQAVSHKGYTKAP